MSDAPLAGIVAALRRGDHAALKAQLARAPALAGKARLVVEAAGLADRAALELLVEHGGDVNGSYRNYRPLHALLQGEPHKESGAPSRERLACLDWLLAHGADPEGLGAWPSARAILVAAFVGAEEYVERLARGGARIDGWVSAALGEVAAVRKALERDPGLARARDLAGLTALQCCAASRLGARDARRRSRLREVASLLLDHGADPNARVRSWAHDVDVAYFAISARHVELFELLLRRGANATAALPSAVWREGTEFAELALRHSADPNEAKEGDRPLLNELVRWGQFSPALWLLEHGADPNNPDPRGWTALHQAASRGNERVFRALLEKGGDPEREDAEGRTPLDIARTKAKARVLAKLVALVAPSVKGDRRRSKAVTARSPRRGTRRKA